MTTEQTTFAGEEWGSRSLAGDFILPPFDVMSAQRGDWQARKRLWIEVLGLGAHDLPGREDRLQPTGKNSPRTSPDFYRKKAEWEKANGQAISTADFNEKYYNVQDGGREEGLISGDYEKNPWRQPRFYEQKTAWEKANGRTIDSREFADKHYDPVKEAGRLRGTTSHFDPVLAEICLAWYSAPGWQVFDPFGGGVERGLVSAYMGRPYVGIELRLAQVRANRELADRLTLPVPVEWIEGDAVNTGGIMFDYPQADFIITCPPYWNLEVYSKEPGDVSNMSLPDFKAAMDSVIQQSLVELKDNRFAVMVMGDRRYGPRKQWAHLPAMMVESFERHGAILHNDILLMTSLGSKPQIARYAFERRRTLMPLYEHALVFIKGDAGKATEALGAVELTEVSHFIGSGGQYKLV